MIPTIAAIKAEVAAHYSLDPVLFDSERRERRVSHPRQVAMYLATRLTALSLPNIGRHFGGRDHTTVSYARDVMVDRMSHSPDLHADVEALAARLKNGTTISAAGAAGSLDAMIVNTLVDAVRSLKDEPRSGLVGDSSHFAMALNAGFDERPAATGTDRTGRITTFYLSERGTWTVVQSNGGTARIIAAGENWATCAGGAAFFPQQSEAAQ